ncbi:hypothetical protein GCM10022251_25370 [Phytohabitans flavus]|uniref:YbaB/EbfC DNA-binding family protein n=1 Tax=Phytohabitans flavus TaxID=1076124 RepID=A0A6F8XR43_9ACTN|nr:hypothetical protein [Phytohabitans flavus]BCB76259.1 hypothetical protein Pflav_026690 [Phytohabitans flavus]
MLDPALFERLPRDPVEATDASGTVRVTVDADGLPESIAVEPGWLRAIGSEGLAAAVTEAAAVAVRQGMTVLADAVAAQRPPPFEPLDEPGLPEVPATSRSLSTVIRDLHRTMDEAPIAFRPEPQVGAAGYGALTITVTAEGRLSCVADPYWVSEQDTDELVSALNTALASARAGLPPVTEPAPDLGARLNDLVAEMRAAMGGAPDPYP